MESKDVSTRMREMGEALLRLSEPELTTELVEVMRAGDGKGFAKILDRVGVAATQICGPMCETITKTIKGGTYVTRCYWVGAPSGQGDTVATLTPQGRLEAVEAFATAEQSEQVVGVLIALGLMKCETVWVETEEQVERPIRCYELCHEFTPRPGPEPPWPFGESDPGS
jgi:hypothetical protein